MGEGGKRKAEGEGRRPKAEGGKTRKAHRRTQLSLLFYYRNYSQLFTPYSLPPYSLLLTPHYFLIWRVDYGAAL